MKEMLVQHLTRRRREVYSFVSNEVWTAAMTK